MTPAFWDSSSLVPLCIRQSSTPVAHSLSNQYEMSVWWAAPVEVRGAFARLARMGQLSGTDQVEAQVRFERLRGGWKEVGPSPDLRDRAEHLVDRFPLKAADALQLAAAMACCSGRPAGRAFISGDTQLLVAARQLGFLAIDA